jgi:hypothetical protein
MEWLDQQYRAQLARRHVNRRPCIHRPSDPLLCQCIRLPRNAADDRGRPSLTGDLHLNHLLSTAESPTHEHRAQQAPPVIIHFPDQTSHALLISDGGVAELHRSPIWKG